MRSGKDDARMGKQRVVRYSHVHMYCLNNVDGASICNAFRLDGIPEIFDGDTNALWTPYSHRDEVVVLRYCSSPTKRVPPDS